MAIAPKHMYPLKLLDLTYQKQKKFHCLSSLRATYLLGPLKKKGIQKILLQPSSQNFFFKDQAYMQKISPVTSKLNLNFTKF